MQTRISIAGVIAVSAFLALMGGASYFVSHSGTKICPLSGREIHPRTRALVSIGEKEHEICCIRCAISQAQQTDKPIRFVEVADFETSRFMEPENAWFVAGSTVNLFAPLSPSAEKPGRVDVYTLAFDRCSPSVLAFSSEQASRDFIAQHGGSLERLNHLQSELTSATGREH